MDIHDASPDSPLLVAVVNNEADLGRALEQGWYRIPAAHAPRPLAADYLALYQTGAFGQQGCCVRFIAPVLGWQLLRRRELLPDEGGHPRAEQLYHRLGLGAWSELRPPLRGGSPRRIVFIPSTLGRLRRAATIRDLWPRGRALTELCAELRAEGFAGSERRLREGGEGS